MPYIPLENYMKNLYDTIVYPVNLYSLYNNPTNINSLLISYPTKKSPGDYWLSLNGDHLTHADLVDVLHTDIINQLPLNQLTRAIELSEILTEILYNGLNANIHHGFNITIHNRVYNSQEFVQIIYWLIGQENINYPQTQGKLGVRLPIMRYQEGIVSAIYPLVCDLDNIRARARGNVPYMCLEGLIPDPLHLRNYINTRILQNINRINLP